MSVANLPSEGLCRAARSFGILSSYPPTACGLATFTAALASGMGAHGTAGRRRTRRRQPWTDARETIASSASWSTDPLALLPLRRRC